MLTLADLEHAAVHPETAKEALAQAERRLAEILETKKATEQKATTLLAAYVTLSVALVGAAVRQHADRVALALMTGGDRLDWTDWVVDVRDAAGRRVLLRPFVEVRVAGRPA